MRRNKECGSKELLSDFIQHLCCLRGDLCWSILRPRIQILSWETRNKVQHRLLASGEGRNLQHEQWNLLIEEDFSGLAYSVFSHNLPVSVACCWE